MRPVKLPKGAKIQDGNRIVLSGPKPRDASQAMSWAKGGRKGVQRCLSPDRARALKMLDKVK